MLRQAIDVSNYSGNITPAQAAQLYQQGVRKAIVQVVNPSILVHRQQIPVLKQAGIDVEAYVYVWFSAGEAFVSNRVSWACGEARALGVSHMWLDCEQSDSDNPPFDYVHQPVTPCIRAAVAAVQANSMTSGIYTSSWWWIPGASNSTEWASLPLWDANYDLDPDLDPANYGGWNVPRMSQYQANVVVAGIPYCDLNGYEGDADMPPTLDRVNELLAHARQDVLDAYYLLNP